MSRLRWLVLLPLLPAVVAACTETPAAEGEGEGEGEGPLAPGVGDLALVELGGVWGADAQPWVELYGRSRRPVTVTGCRLEGQAAGEETWRGGLLSSVATSTIAPLGRLVIVVGDCGTFPARVPCTSGDGAALADGGAGRLRLVCPGDAGEELTVDTVDYDLAASPLAAGQSLSFPEESFGTDPADFNDTAQLWCVAAATPSGDNACLDGGAEGEGEGEGADPGLPGPGELVFTELFVRAPTGERQWVELLNVADRTLDALDGCTLGFYDLAQTPPPATVKALVFDEEVAIPPGGRLVLRKTECTETFAELPCAHYPTITLRSTKPDRLVLSCPAARGAGTQEIDRIEYTLADRGVATGQSLAFPEAELGDDPAASNDHQPTWCPAPPTPGEPNACAE